MVENDFVEKRSTHDGRLLAIEPREFELASPRLWNAVAQIDVVHVWHAILQSRTSVQHGVRESLFPLRGVLDVFVIRTDDVRHSS